MSSVGAETELPEPGSVEQAVPAADETPTESGFRDVLHRHHNVRLELSCELGDTSMELRSLLALSEGSVVRVGRPVGEDLGLRLNGVSFGRADVMVVDARVLLRLTEIGDDD